MVPALATQGGRSADKNNLATFLSEFHTAINNEVLGSGQSRLLLTLMASSFDPWVGAGYNMQAIHPSVDW